MSVDVQTSSSEWFDGSWRGQEMCARQGGLVVGREDQEVSVYVCTHTQLWLGQASARPECLRSECLRLSRYPWLRAKMSASSHEGAIALAWCRHRRSRRSQFDRLRKPGVR